MKFCQHCGKEILDEAIVCVGCGCSIQPANTIKPVEIDETVSIGLVVLAVLIPLFGIIYWPVKNKTRPKCAKACGIAGIISWIVYLAFMIFMSAVEAGVFR